MFLAEYNPAKRKARGVWYTPEPVVNFIVRAVDEVLKTEFGLADGLADTSKITIDWDGGQNDPKTGKPATTKREVHRVQILDPATGTGTFLAEVVKLVAERIKGVAPGQLSAYIERDLIPRLHGFELLMASYAMCHMKLDMILTRLGYTPSANPPRLGVYLTNSLEEGERVEQTLFGLSRAIANEAKAASDIKRQTPIMCVIGNPPYSVSSHNKSDWIQGLIDDYKRGLVEKKINLDDDYIKFIRFSQALIQRNGFGVIGMITNNSFLDGVTHRKMRQNLLEYFDTIFVLDLHGSSTKKEVSLDGVPHKNVFDIMQGVSVCIMVKTTANDSGMATLYHADLLGSRDSKYESLWKIAANAHEFKVLEPVEPYYFFVPKNFDGQSDYDEFFSIQDLCPENGSGVKTERDKVCIHFDQKGIEESVNAFHAGDIDSIKTQYHLQKDSRDWTVSGAILDIRRNFDHRFFKRIFYRPFDIRYTYYTGSTRGFMGTPGRKIGRQLFQRNIGLILSRTVYGSADWHDTQVTDSIVEFGIMATRVGNTAPIFPLYLYPEEGTLDQTIRVNFEPKLYARIRTAAGLTGPHVAPDGTDAFRTATGDARPDEVQVFDYIYGVLHSPAYRQRYAEFLKIDFPRVPFPPSPDVFADISAKGEALRRLHLMEDAAIGPTPFPFEGDGDSVVEKPRYDGGKVWINATQGFTGVSPIAWEFHIGGYQPAQKWLKDRKGRALTYDNIRHYQRIIKILAETDRIMRTIALPLD